MTKPYAHRVSGFTLVELVVVIAIVTLLMTFLIPAFTQAKEATYISMCGNNLRQSVVGLTAYCFDWKESIPPSCSRNDGESYVSGVTTYDCGPYTAVPAPSNKFIGAGSYRGNLARWDNGTDYSYVHGMALMWASGYVPYDLGGLRCLWCPTQGGTAGLLKWGPGQFWFKTGQTNFGINDHPFSSIVYGGSSNTAGNWTMVVSYAYRSIGYEPQTTVNLSSCITKGSWRLSNLAPYCAEVDYATEVNGKDTAGNAVNPTLTHGGSTHAYIGTNRLFYDGHVKWLSDPQKAFGQYVGGGASTALANTCREGAWKNLYDVN